MTRWRIELGQRICQLKRVLNALGMLAGYSSDEINIMGLEAIDAAESLAYDENHVATVIETLSEAFLTHLTLRNLLKD